MPTITPPSVPSRFQLRARFMRLIPALFLPTSRPVTRYPVRLYFKAVRRLFDNQTVDTPLFYLTFIKPPCAWFASLSNAVAAVIGDISRVKNLKWLESERPGDQESPR